MTQYLQLLEDVLWFGSNRTDRTGTGVIGLFGRQLRFRLSNGFPLLTTKKLHVKSIIHELLWFLKGDTNIKYLNDNGVTIWDEWADENGDLGPIYGKQWRDWDGVDQISNLIKNLKETPFSRRHVVSAWNVGQIDKMALPPCHCLFQFYVTPPHKWEDKKNKLSLQLYQRSADLFLGVPFNIASYSLLLMMVAQVCDMEPFEFIHTFGDVHVYLNHKEQAYTQLERKPRELPTMEINPEVKSIDDFKYEDFHLTNYNPYPAIKADVSV